MASGNISLSGDVSQATGRISWSSTANQSGNYSLVNADVYVILKGWGIQGTGSGKWYENDSVANTFKAKVNIAYGGSGTTLVYSKSGIKVAHDTNGNATIKLGANMSFSFAGVDYIKGSGTCTMDKIPRYAEVKLLDISNYGMNYINISYNTDVTVDRAWYSINDGSYILIKEEDHKSNSFTINNLSPDTVYKIKIKVRRKDSQLTSESNSTSIRTFNKAKITVAPNITVGENATIEYTNPSGAATAISIVYGEITLANYRNVSTSPYTLTFTQDEINKIYEQMAESTSIEVKYYIRTIQNGVSYYDSVTRIFSINQSENLPSAPSNITYADVNSTTLALTNDSSKILLGYSNVKVNIGTASTAKNKAYIKNYSITDGTTTKTIAGTGSAPYFDTIEKIKRASIDVFAFDSRGLSSKSSKALTILDYQTPQINSETSLKRVNGVGTSVVFTFSGYIWNKSFGKVANTIKNFRYKMLPTTSTNWDSVEWINIDSSKYTLASNGTIANVTDAILPNFTIGIEYNVKIQLTDQLDQNAEIILNINSGEPITAYNKSRKLVGVGKIPDKTLPQGSIDAKGDIVAGGKVKCDSFDSDVGSANSGYKQGGNVILRNNGTDTIISGKDGKIYFRAKGTTNSSGETTLDSDGTFNAPTLLQNGKKIMGYNGVVGNSLNFNQAIYHGIYMVSYANTVDGAPYEGAIYGTLEVTVSTCDYWNQTNNWIWQVLKTTLGKTYSRYAVNSGSFSSWIQEDKTQVVLDSHPVGSVFITSTNSNPANKLGGTWELIDKEFKPWNGNVSWTNNNASAEVSVSRHGHSIFVRVALTTTTTLTDSAVTLGKINLNDIGINEFTYQKYYTPWADGADAIAYMVIKGDGTIESVDVNQASGNRSVSSGAYFVVNFVDVARIDTMWDSSCNKFFWKRTA